MAYTPARPDRRRLIVAQLPGRRGEPFVHSGSPPGCAASASVLSRCLPWRFERPSDCPSWLRGRPETCTANREETDAGRDDRRDDLRAHN